MLESVTTLFSFYCAFVGAAYEANLLALMPHSNRYHSFVLYRGLVLFSSLLEVRRILPIIYYIHLFVAFVFALFSIFLSAYGRVAVARAYLWCSAYLRSSYSTHILPTPWNQPINRHRLSVVVSLTDMPTAIANGGYRSLCRDIVLPPPPSNRHRHRFAAYAREVYLIYHNLPIATQNITQTNPTNTSTHKHYGDFGPRPHRPRPLRHRSV